MPNVTITLTYEEYRNARIWAALNDTTVTAAIRTIVQTLPILSAGKIGILPRSDSRVARPAAPSAKAANIPSEQRQSVR